MTSCPCGSELNLDECCGPIISGGTASTAEILLRSRYTAFVLGNIGYLADTLSLDMLPNFDQVEAEKTARDAKWQGLELRTITDGGANDESGSIEFVARFKLGGEQRIHHEIVNFGREGGRWVCTGGKVNPKGPPRISSKVGRNEPCPCGSGNKFKKCCGR